ncbi:hypothetical protein AHiyo4_08320 [Arthrobacter sp. Hiyo4]|nr:hypothetical protein AHiyo4_08320 [Arthrobacter sp. Hiyo4]
MLVRAVVGNQVHDDPQPQTVGLGNHDVEVIQGAEDRIHVAVIADVIAGVALRGFVEGGQPDGVHIQLGQLRKFLGNPREIADAVAVEVPEGPGYTW